MIPTEHMQRHIKALVSQNPLAEGEVRRVEGMGELYMSLSPTASGPDYEPLYALVITDDQRVETRYHFFAKIS